jgi:putative PIN family toxin of toxin-antitoxin system
VDTSTLVSAILRPGSTPDLALQKALRSFEVSASAETLAELDSVLARSKFDRYSGLRQRKTFIEDFRKNCRLLTVTELDLGILIPSCRDPRDNKFLALALAAGADAIVSSDEDLLILHPWRGIPILTPAQFIAG